MLSLKQLQDVCLYYQGADQCRYLDQDEIDFNKWYCLKLRTTVKKKIDEKLTAFVKECRKNGDDPAAAGKPMGDNCKGYLLLRSKEQGYDKP